MGPEKIYQILRDKIIWLELAPESILNLSELANEYNVSRTPVKEALIHLQADGWISGFGSRFMVTPLSLERFREITEIRIFLEVEANVLAMKRLLPEELRGLEEIEEESHKFDNTMSNKQVGEADYEFHGILYDATKNKNLSQLLHRLLSHYIRFWLSLQAIVEPSKYYVDVEKIIQAVKRKDEEKLREATLSHVTWAADKIMEYF
ncbi:GntR family transcriptional regulator [Thermodesulfobacteriota bacterium]